MKNPIRNYIIAWIARTAQQEAAYAAAAAASAAISQIQPATATGAVYGDVVGDLLGPLDVQFLHPLSITAAQLTADQNDYLPDNGTAAMIWRLSADGTTRYLTGIAASDQDGEWLVLVNLDATADIGLRHLSSSSAAANRILCPGGADLTLPAYSALILFYDGDQHYWQVVGSAETSSGSFVTTAAGGGELVQAHGAMGSSETVDLANGNIHIGTLDANCTLTFTGYSAVHDGISFALFLTQDGTGGWTVTWPAEVANAADINAALDTTAGGLQIVTFVSADDGVTVYGFVVGEGGAAVTFGTPNLSFGTSNTAGATDEVIRRDAGLAIFDTTVPVTQAFSDSAATGSAAFAARRDHVHGMPASPAVTGGTLLISDTPSTPLVFADLIQNEAQDDLVYAD